MAEQKGIENPDKSPNLLNGAKDSGKLPHDKETHGTSDDINANTPIDQIKGPSVFERAKEEVEALVDAVIHPKK